MKFLVPVDGSAASEQAVDYAVWWARQLPDTTILLLNVQSRETLGFTDISALSGDERELAARMSEKVLHGAATRCDKTSGRVETRAGYGKIPETIAKVAQDEKVEQIVMGTHGRGRLGTAVLGSVAAGVIHLAHVPVTLLKQGERHWA